MSQSSSRGFKGKSSIFFDRDNADIPDNCGNRKTFEEMKIPPDNMGNRMEQNISAPLIHDNLGNSLDEEPAHLRSGVLSHLAEQRSRKGSYKEFAQPRSILDLKKPRASVRMVPREPIKHQKRIVQPLKNTDEGYLMSLADEFAKLLSKKSGLPFSFAMKPINDQRFDEDKEQVILLAIKSTVEQILSATEIQATVRVSRYHTPNIRFGVFFIHPSERDPLKNKELISALRQTLKLHLSNFPAEPTNVLLVLSNAEKIIEDHLYKIGAKKVN